MPILNPTPARRPTAMAAAGPPEAFDTHALRCEFLLSPELATLDPRDRELGWVDELLDAMEAASWTWDDLDMEIFETLLLDGFTWTIERSPEDPGRVARVLAAFFDFAGRARGAPHASVCASFLRSPAAVADIARWLHPQPLSPVSRRSLVELGAPYNWCDSRCACCVLADRCPATGTTSGGHRVPAPVRAAELPAGAGQADVSVPRSGDWAAAAAGAGQADVSLPRFGDWAGAAAASRLRRRCHDFALALLALAETLSEKKPDPSVAELAGDARLVSARGVRIAQYLARASSAGGNGVPVAAEVVPDLLLIERVLARIDCCVGAHPLPACAAAYLAARDELHQQLEPLLRSIPSCYRGELAVRVHAGLAPSPFVSIPARHVDPL